MSRTARSLLSIRQALSLAAVVAAVAAGAFFLLRAEANVDLNSTPADLTVSGEAVDDRAGFSMASGDINGDTVDDLIVGAKMADAVGTGNVYVIYGDVSLPGTIDLSSMNADITVVGGNLGDELGFDVAAGDVNGDTIDDLVMGTPFADPGLRFGAGATFVIFGGGSLPATIDLSSTSADVAILGDDDSDASGSAVATGDIDGDTTDDIIIGAPNADPAGGGNAGEAYAIYGAGGLPATIDLNSVSADLTLYGDNGGERLGGAVTAGDINDDSTTDLIVGAHLADPVFGTDAGVAYAIYGGPALPATIDLDSEPADLTVWGPKRRDKTGVSVAAGDINGDTADDLILGAPGSPAVQFFDSPGKVLVVYGGPGLPALLDLDVVNPANGIADVTVLGDDIGDELGVAVAVGDISSDTTDDLVIGAYHADPFGRINAGETYVVYGGGSLPATIDVTDTSAVLTIFGAGEGDESGHAVAAGNINGDTFEDVLTGAPSNILGLLGHAYAVFGGPPPTPTSTPTATVPSATPTITPTHTITLTPTVTPTKIAIDGNLSGVFDILVHDGTKTDQSSYCKARTDHDTTAVDASGGEALKTAATCYLDTPGQEAPGNKVPTDPNIDLAGPPPPPPYGSAGPIKGNGSYCPTGSGGCTDVLGNPMPEGRSVVVTCFPSQGGILGPNVIWVTTVDDVKVDVANQSGAVDIHYGQGILECDSKAPKGPPTLSFSINLTRYDQEPYDNITSVDSDGDGCSDALELDKRRLKKDCGDDPWNPHDSDLNFNASFSIIIEVERADTCHGGQPFGAPPVGCDPPAVDQDIVAGSYYNCQAFLDHDLGDDSVTGKAFCYTDNPVTTVNIEDNGGNAQCAPFPSTNPEDCGDGLPGSPPPGPFADNDGMTTPGVITGVLDKGSNRLILDVCFSGVENPTEGPNLYMRLDVDAHTGLGSADIWLMRTSCDKPLPGDAPTENDVPVSVGEQNDANCSFTTSNPACYDVDQDGCSARQELGTDVFHGGQRDPFSKFDHMDINKDGTINVPDDIIGTMIQFGPAVKIQQGNVGPRLVGSVPWAHSNGDTAIGIPDDILGVAAQFGHNCQ